jgi:hypothetical protein
MCVDDGELNGIVFLDIGKVFDSISHDKLLQTMKRQFHFGSFLANRSREQVNGTMSSFIKVKLASHKAQFLVHYWPLAILIFGPLAILTI